MRSTLFVAFFISVSLQSQEWLSTKQLQSLKNLKQRYLSLHKKEQKKFNEISLTKSISHLPKEYFCCFTNGIPTFYDTLNAGAARSSRVDELYNMVIDGQPVNLSGSGLIAYVWDGGVIRSTHQEFTGRVTIAPGQTPVANHPTQVAGTLAASGFNPSAKGMAPAVSMISYDFQDNVAEIADATSAQLSNHSYGLSVGWVRVTGSSPTKWRFISNYKDFPLEANFFGMYHQRAAEYDEIVYNNPYHIFVKSAGNSFGAGPAPGDLLEVWDEELEDWVPLTGPVPPKNCFSGYDCLIADGTAKNLIIVGATAKINDPANNNGVSNDPSKIIKTSFSSAGPRDDGGIKPDIAAVGLDVFSPAAASDTAYAINGGTSFSSPVVAGIMVLVKEFYESFTQKMLRADTAKAILLHNAAEAGLHPGPDYYFGWGFANAPACIEHIAASNKHTYIGEHSISRNGSFSVRFKAAGNQPLKATVVWIDPPAEPDLGNQLNPRKSKIVHDLNFVVRRSLTKQPHYPWKLDPNNPSAPATKGINRVDNVEQVLIENPLNDWYEFEITHSGNLTTPQQDFALVISGLEDYYFINQTNLHHFVKIVKKQKESNFTIVNEGLKVQIQSIELFDMNGRLIKTFSPEAAEISSYSIEEKGFGAYIVQIQTNKGILRQKILR